jgi:hypothetical protein
MRLQAAPGKDYRLIRLRGERGLDAIQQAFQTFQLF